MSVILQIGSVVWTQGWSGEINGTLANTGTENAKDIHLKVVDAVVFTALAIRYSATSWTNCLNVVSSGKVYNLSDGNYLFPAGATKTIRLKPTVKAGAPVQVHSINCNFTYTVY